jgi:hypothetical protein
MKKFRGKALAAVLSLALIASSFPVTFASASTKHATGVLTKDPDEDEFWLVNGGSSKDDRSIENFEDQIYKDGIPLETADHQDVDDPQITSISRVSGDNLVSWDIDDDNDGETKLSLRKSDSEGDEVIAVLYKGTYTDDDDNEIEVRASTKIQIHAVDDHSTVVGDASTLIDQSGTDYFADSDGLIIGTDSPELVDDDTDDYFALKTTSKKQDSKIVSAFRAVRANENGGGKDVGCLAEWQTVKTIAKNSIPDGTSESDFLKDNANPYAYVLEASNNSDVDLSSSGFSLLDGGVDGLTVAADKDGKLVITNNNTTAYKYAVNAGSLADIAAKTGTTAIPITAADTMTADTTKVTIYTAGSTDTNRSEKAVYLYRGPVEIHSSVSQSSNSVSGISAAIDTDPTKVVITNTTATTYYAAVNDGDPTSNTLTDGSSTPSTWTTTALSDEDEINVYSDAGKTTKVATFVYHNASAAATDYVYATVKTDANSANLTFKGKLVDAYNTGDNVNDDDDIKAKVKLDKMVLADDAQAKYTILKDDHKTKITSSSDSTGIQMDGGYEVKFANNCDGVSEVTAKEDASIDGIIGKVKSLTVDDAKKVGDINLKAGDVYVEDSDVNVGDITTKKTATVKIDADNSVGNITIKDKDDGGSKVDMSAGSAKSITCRGDVTLTGTEDDQPISVGTLMARTVDIDSGDGAVSVTKVVFKAPGNDESGTEFDLEGDQTTVKAIDFAGYGVDMKFDDFQGSLPAPVNATDDDALIETSDEDDDVTFTGDADIKALTVEDESEVTFAGKLSVDDLDGSGTMYIGANKLYVGEDATGVLVKITDNSIKSGDTIFTAASDEVDDDDLDFYGFNVKCKEGKTTDTFVVDQLKFAGLAMNKTSDKIVLNDSATYTASAYAPGTSLPDGYSIEFDMEDNSGVFEMTDNGNGTASVKCVDYDDVFSEENKATLKAYVLDESGDQDDDYGEATCKLTALKTPEKNFTSDTNNDFTLAHGASYQFKITAQVAPVMTSGTSGVVDITNVGKSGNDYFIKVTAKGATGAKTGIYVNGTKLLVITVGGAAAFTSDTTTNLTVKKGASYQYKITSSAAPAFTLGSAGVFNYSLVSHSGNAYIYKITAVGAVGATTGVYVNGQKVNVAKVG